MHIATLQIMSIVIYVWISIKEVATLEKLMLRAGIPGYLISQNDGTGCLSMQYQYPWKTEVDVDRFIFKDGYRLNKDSVLNKESMDLKDLYIFVQSVMATNTRGLILITKNRIPGFASSKMFSHFLCADEILRPYPNHHIVLAFHMCKSNIGQTQKTGLFVRNIAGKLANEIPEIRKYMDTENVQMSVKKSRCAADPYTCLDIAVIQPLKFTYTIPPHKRIFLVSGLDECGHMVYGNHTTIPKLLGIKLNDFPPWIKFLFISRDEQTVLKYFPTLQKHNIEMKDLRQLSRTYNKKNSEKKDLEFIYFAVLNFFVIGLAFCLGIYFPEEDPVSISIHRASSIGNVESVLEHLRRGHDVNDVHEGLGLTPLHLAAINGHAFICSVLLQYGADANIEIPFKSFEKILFVAESNIQIKDLKNATAIRLATLFRHKDIVKILLKDSNELEISKCLRFLERRRTRYDIISVISTFIKGKLEEKYEKLNLIVIYCYVAGNRRHCRFLAYSRNVVQTIEGRIYDIQYLIQNPRKINFKEILADLQNRNIEESDRLTVEAAIQHHGERLFKNHSNLNVISGSAIKSMKSGSILKRKPCVVLYCSSKGYIPFDEDPFPKTLYVGKKDVDVDVREGYFALCPAGITMSEWNNPLRIGGSIGRKGGLSGTLGPFVELSDGSLGFITCAHVFQNDNPGRNVEVVQPSYSSFAGMDITDEDRKCGFLLHKVFNCNQEVSVDAALVKVLKRHPERALFTIGSTEELLETGFEVNDKPLFDDGSIKETIDPEDVKKIVIKFGCKTGLTRGAFRLRGCSVRVAEATTFSSPNVVMKNQYEIQSIGPTSFFQPGDSGSAVFLVDDTNRLHCIGIAIGCTSYQSAIVTPIASVLTA